MIRYGLKLWSSNSKSQFERARDLFLGGSVGCIEVYHDPRAATDRDVLSILSGCRVTIHNTHSHGWHEFELGDAQMAVWRGTLALADFFGSDTIVVHPGLSPDIGHFRRNLMAIDDPRIVIENMAGADIYGRNMYACTLPALREFKKLHPICFDIEKAVKAARYLERDYRGFIEECLRDLSPSYFHISGGDKDSPMDQHLDLWDATFDVGWMRKTLEAYSTRGDITLIFETPRKDESLANDEKNMEFFRVSQTI